MMAVRNATWWRVTYFTGDRVLLGATGARRSRGSCDFPDLSSVLSVYPVVKFLLSPRRSPYPLERTLLPLLPCRWELPEIETVYRRFQNDPRVIILAVDAGWQGETVGKAKEFLARKKLQLPAAFDNNGAARALGVDSLPTVILIGQEATCG
jgi:hypothetical protein